LNAKLIVAIDGPSGAGKSTLSKALAHQLNYINIDTGAMYRSVALMAQRRGVDLANQNALKALCNDLTIEFIRSTDSEIVLVNGEDVSLAIRTPEVSLLTAKVAASPVVREAMVEQQRSMGKSGGVVLEGRDIGSVVFPDAQVKFFLSATATERGRRRYDELRAKGVEVNLEQTIAEVEARDQADSEREHAPLVQVQDAISIDSTRMSINEVLAEMIRLVRIKEESIRF
jgi:CMP/dCMP kinase